jgi:hypothetical membrane protein
MNTPHARWVLVAGLVCGCALLALGAQVEGYSHARHPVALAGARGVPMATLFNTMVFVLPGLVLILVGGQLRRALPAGAAWSARIGTTLLQLSALAFAAQGLLPLDLGSLDQGASRLHATAWMAWWLAYAVAALLLAWAIPRQRPGLLVGALLVIVLSLLAGGWIPAGYAQRLAFAAWFAGIWWIARDGAVSRGAA